MGKKGRAIVGLDIGQLLKELNSAYADEWIAYFYYTWAADFVEGLNYPNVAGELDNIAKDELEHMSELAERIFELGGEPERDLEGVLKAVIKAEGCAIDVYNKLIKKLSPCYEKDLRTFHLIEHILSEEIQHEEAFENLMPTKPK